MNIPSSHQLKAKPKYCYSSFQGSGSNPSKVTIIRLVCSHHLMLCLYIIALCLASLYYLLSSFALSSSYLPSRYHRPIFLRAIIVLSSFALSSSYLPSSSLFFITLFSSTPLFFIISFLDPKNPDNNTRISWFRDIFYMIYCPILQI